MEQDYEIDSLRNLIDPNSQDPIIKQLNLCSSVQDVFDIIKENENILDVVHLSQCVLILWDLQKNYYQVNQMLHKDLRMIPSNIDPQIILKVYMQEVTSHPTFIKLMNLIDLKYQQFSVHELSCTLLYLTKMSIPLRNQIIQKLITKCEDELKLNDIEHFPLPALSRFIVAVCNKKGLYPILVVKDSLAIILKELENCSNAEDFRLITICLCNMYQLVTERIVEAYKIRANYLLDTSKINKEHLNTIMRIIHFLFLPHWSTVNSEMICKLLLILKGQIGKLEMKDLFLIHKAIFVHLEPREILSELQEAGYKMLVENTLTPITVETAPDLLACIVPFSAPSKRHFFEELARKYIENDMLPSTVPSLFNVLRCLKTNDIKLCHAFWSKTLDCLRDNVSEREDFKLLRVCYRYMYFNNNLAGTYRNYKLEKQIIEWLLNELENGVCGIIPTKVARAVSFILAYGYDGRNGKEFLDQLKYVSSKFNSIVNQLNELDCLNLSRGLQIGYECNRKTPFSLEMSNIYDSIHESLNKHMYVYLQREYSDLNKPIILLKSVTNRRTHMDLNVFKLLIEKYLYVSETSNLSSRLVREITFSLQSVNCLVPEIMDKLVNYIIKNKKYVLGDTAGKMLYFCYDLGYSPHRSNEFFTTVGEIIDVEKHRLTGLNLIQSSLALCFFHRLPQSLIQYIFSEQFLEQLDKEIENSFSKLSYPLRVRKTLMQLNRSVCLDYPECEVPWFHQNYSNELINEGKKKSLTHQFYEILSTLTKIVGGREFITTNTYSPYKYKIDYLVHLDQFHKPINVNNGENGSIMKVAFILLQQNAMTILNKNLKGSHQLKRRHLEMLGYKVVFVDTNVMNLAPEFNNNEDYLRSNLWPGCS